MSPILYTDYYKTEHYKMYPQGMTKLYSNFTPRKSRIKGVDRVVFFGLQHFIKEYLIKKFQKEFFDVPLEEVIEEYKFAINTDTKHIEDLHKLGYLPIKIKAVPEGTLVNIGVPCFTITNTKGFAWLTNYLETLISAQMWQAITSATLAFEFKKMLVEAALETGGSLDFVQWQGHDFSMRGMSSIESAILSGMGHLLSFTGTDTIPAIYGLKKSYNAEGLIGASVPATEHSVMCMGTKEDEIGTVQRLLDLYPSGILSVVLDTWSLPKVVCEYLPRLKETIMKRDGKLVVRPDSFWTDPVDCICGFDGYHPQMEKLNDQEKTMIRKGLIESLWDIFGGTTNDKGYRELDSHIGAIYGDSISLERGREISKRLKDKGFASTNIVYGVGSFTYQYNTRDTFGFAMKATYGEVLECVEQCHTSKHEREGFCVNCVSKGREIYKDPITDDGTKRSAKGLIRVDKVDLVQHNSYGKVLPAGYMLKMTDGVSWEEEAQGILETVFEDGKLIKETSLSQIRERLGKA